ncbi:MAG: YceH family protein [Desulfobulbaceae bacterium]|nr:YceH family protein [Desulfobulbaceae bacterium]
MVDFELTSVEVRVLGCLMEKEMTTPEYYPLSLNALVNACNQKSNRNPVVSYDEATVLQALSGLKENHLAWQSDAARVSKYEHLFGKMFNLVAREMAVICLLLLRGPQTAGELRTRAERMYAFGSLDETAETMRTLEEMGLVRQLPRQPGQKEPRFVHLLAGEPEYAKAGEEVLPDEMIPRGPGMGARIAALEDEIRNLRGELNELKQDFLDFKDQFE